MLAEDLMEYEDINGVLIFKMYVTILFGMRNNVKYCKFDLNKEDAFDTYLKIYENTKFQFSECDSRGYDIKNEGKCILNAFDNDVGLLTTVGFDKISDIFCYFNNTYIHISQEPDLNFKKNIKLTLGDVMNKIKI